MEYSIIKLDASIKIASNIVSKFWYLLKDNVITKTVITNKLLVIFAMLFLIGTSNIFSITWNIPDKTTWDLFASENTNYVFPGCDQYKDTFLLTADIGDANNPVTQLVKWNFSGVFDGNGHVIYVDINNENNLVNQGVGLFSSITGATIKNLVVDGNLYGKNAWMGGIVGYVAYSEIHNCVNMANVTSDFVCLGGIVGHAERFLYISNCINLGTITYNGQYGAIGGIIGHANDPDTIIEDCVNAGFVSGNDDIGGIAGEIGTGYDKNGTEISTTITNCINIGRVEGKGSIYGIAPNYPLNQ